MSPSFFQVSPVREISHSRVTLRSTIHCCSVVSSRKRRVSPPGERMSHIEPPSGGGSGGRGGGCALLRLILNRFPQDVHLTVTPASVTFESSSSYSVWHFSQRTSIAEPDWL